MMRWMLRVLGASLLIAVVAQPASGVVTHVSDYDGSPLIDYTFTFTNRETNETQTVNTDAYGNMNINPVTPGLDVPSIAPHNTVFLPPGTWDVSVSREGNHVLWQKNCVEVNPDGTMTVRNIRQQFYGNDPAALPEYPTPGNLRVDISSNAPEGNTGGASGGADGDGNGGQ